MEKYEEIINKIKEHSKEAYDGKRRNYKQKLLYGLLTALRNNDRNKFLNIFYTNLNAMNEDKSQKLVSNLDQYKFMGPNFERYAYAIIAGILASNDDNSEQIIQKGKENE